MFKASVVSSHCFAKGAIFHDRPGKSLSAGYLLRHPDPEMAIWLASAAVVKVYISIRLLSSKPNS